MELLFSKWITHEGDRESWQMRTGYLRSGKDKMDGSKRNGEHGEETNHGDPWKAGLSAVIKCNIESKPKEI